MIKILVNDGISESGAALLKQAGFEVDMKTVPQEELAQKLPFYDAIIVRSATEVRKELIDQCPRLKVIGRGGVGLDNIDVAYAKERGIQVINTPAASSRSVAELVMGHILTLSRSLHIANREMPLKGDTEFKNLKKRCEKGAEIKGKTLGVIGFGRIGQASASLAIGAGMKVLASDPFVNEANLEIDLAGHPDGKVIIPIKTVAFEEVLANSDYITLHVPNLGKPLIAEAEFSQMKDGVVFINAARGGTSCETAMMRALESGKISAAGLDVFETEPIPNRSILANEKVSLSPHIGASTLMAQDNIGTELAEQLISIFK